MAAPKKEPNWKKWVRRAGANGMTEAEYREHMVAKHGEARAEGMLMMERICKRHGNESADATAFYSGLSTATVHKYRMGKWGTRGPALTTYLALKQR